MDHLVTWMGALTTTTSQTTSFPTSKSFFETQYKFFCNKANRTMDIAVVWQKSQQVVKRKKKRMQIRTFCKISNGFSRDFPHW